jgi:MFS transporter, FHS family, L-fucose permease
MATPTIARPLAGGYSPGTNTTGPLVIITILFFMWGLLTSLNDVLIPHLKAIYTLSYVQAMLVQFCFFGAYAIISLPAGILIKKIGYQKGAVTGLLIAAAGCALFYPAAAGSYAMFLFAFFILAGGLTVLQVAANPYVAVLGPPKTASSRLNLTQAFNSLGTTIGPVVGGVLILSGAVFSADQVAALSAIERAAHYAKEAAAVQVPYLGLAAALALLAVLFAMARLPKISHAEDPIAAASDTAQSALSHPNLLLGAIGIFLYVGGEVSIGSFLISFLGEPHIGGLTAVAAAHYVAVYWGGAMVGRFIGSLVMQKVSPGKALAFNSAMAIALLLLAVFGTSTLAMWSVLAIGLFNSIMFPTIFTMALHRLGKLTGQASGILCMAIVGGALVPFAQGMVADALNVQKSFLVPTVCYAFILFYGLKFAKLYQEE